MKAVMSRLRWLDSPSRDTLCRLTFNRARHLETDDVHIGGVHHHPRTVMIVAILDDETPCRGRHPQ
jgi:hypothetical protein